FASAIYSNRHNEASFSRSSRFFVPGSVQLGLQAFGVFLVIVLCVGRVLAVAAGRKVAVRRRAGRAGVRIPQLGAYEGLRAVIERLLDRDPHDDAGQLAPHLAPLYALGRRA